MMSTFPLYLRIKKRRYGVIMHDGGMLGEYERSCKTRGIAECFTRFSSILPTFSRVHYYTLTAQDEIF